MGAIYDQTILRLSPEFRSFMNTAAINAAMMVAQEPAETPWHAERVAMAEKVMQTQEQVVNNFISRLILQAVLNETVRSAIISNGVVNLMLTEAQETFLVNAIIGLWDETTLAVWPSISGDIA